MTPKPFFSIGVATYNRLDFLRQNVRSLREQTFTDYEVVIGNNYVERELTKEDLGVDDDRIRIVNHPENLGTLGNMNALLTLSQGRYFTWLNDDDLYDPHFLSIVREAISDYRDPRCVFTSYEIGDTFSAPAPDGKTVRNAFPGRQFLKTYLARGIKTLGCYGVFESGYIKGVGGMEKLGNQIAIYSDNLLAIRTGLLREVIFIDAPLIFFRVHDGSLSATSTNFEGYRSAQEDLCERCIPVFRDEAVGEDFNVNLHLLLRWCMGDMIAVWRRSGSLSPGDGRAYLRLMSRYMSLLKRSDLKMDLVKYLVSSGITLPLKILKDKCCNRAG